MEKLKKHVAGTAITISMALLLTLAFLLVGCTGNQGNVPALGEQDQSQSTPAFHWSCYVASIAEVDDHATDASYTHIQGRLVKVVVGYVSDSQGLCGFNFGKGTTILDTLQTSPLVLTDSSGNTYTYTGGIGNITFNDPADATKGIQDIQPTFSLCFDVPSNTPISDLSLVVEDQTVPLSSSLS